MKVEQLNKIRAFLVENVFRDPKIMFSDECRGDKEGYFTVDLPEVIASLYEVLHREVTGETYNYMFHWANKIGSWVEDELFTEEGDEE